MSNTLYPLKLNNEFRISINNIEKTFKKKKVYVLGYGSLLFPKGWRNRGMKIRTKEQDLIECTLNNYERGPFGIHSKVHFYGAIFNEHKYFNAVLNPISSINDWLNLMNTEFIKGLHKNYNYRVVDVTNFISGVKLPKNVVVHMVANESKNKILYQTYTPAPNYYPYVWNGVKKFRTIKFQHEFLKTGGLAYNIR